MELTEIQSRDDAVVPPGLPLLRLADLHGFDEPTRELLRRLARGSTGVALLVLPGAGEPHAARETGEQEARACSRWGTAALRECRYAEAESAFRAGLAACSGRAPDRWFAQLSAGLAGSLVEQARYAEAEAAVDCLQSTPLPVTARQAVSQVRGRAAGQRTGDDGGQLDEAWLLAERLGDERLMVRAACARAEAAWIGGRAHGAAAEVRRVWQLALEQSDPWTLGELSWWQVRSGGRPASSAPVAAPFRAMLDGGWRAAADAWLGRGRPVWAAYALGCSPSPADARRALALLDDAGAVAAGEAVVRQRHAARLPVPPRPRPATRANPRQLTPRELEILGLLTDGLTNPQIARRLFLSERTVGHHVSAILQKLDLPNRSAAVATALREGMVPRPRAAT